MQNADYLVVVELLSDPDGRTSNSLSSLLGVELETLEATLTGLERDGVIDRSDSVIRLSAAVQRLDQLNLIAL